MYRRHSKKKRQKGKKQLVHSVTHVKRKQHKNEMETAKIAGNAHKLKEAKCVRDISPAVRAIRAVSITGGTPVWYLCCQMDFHIGLLMCFTCNGEIAAWCTDKLFPSVASPFSRRKSEKITAPGASC